MRLWHKYLIPYLPKQQLLGQWRECCLIAKQIAKFGTPRHLLVNKIMNYSIDHFISYTVFISCEMFVRGYEPEFSKFIKNLGKAYNENYYAIPLGKIFEDWHDDQYLRQCYFNLQEKYDCGGISDDEWNRIAQRFSSECE